MTEVGTIRLALGDQVRVHFHSPNPMRSFCEGMVSRVDVTTPEGRFFAMEVTHEVILDREHRVRRGFQDYVRYEDRNDFPGRIEVLSTAEQDGKGDDETDQDAGLSQVEAPDEIAQGRDAEHDRHEVHLERQEVRRSKGLIAALFGRQG